MSWRARARVAAASAAAAVLVLAGAELALRAAAGAPEPELLLRAREDVLGVLAPHPERAFTTAAHARASPAHAGPYATGAWPFRGRPPEPAPPDAVRVVVLGDSCAHGIGVRAAETFAEALHGELVARGADPARLQVLNLGVPGYSLAQIAALAGEEIPALAPAAAVLLTSLWNDQAPALEAPDEEVLAHARSRGPLARALDRSALAHVFRGDSRPPQEELEAITRAWEEEGRAPFGTRVAEERVEPLARALLRGMSAAGAELCVVLPAVPEATRARHPRLARDAESLRRGAAGEGAAAVEGGALLRESGLSDAELFVDFVHPSPPAHALLARGAAERLAGVVARASGGGAAGELRVLGVAPPEVPALGDARIAVEVAGWGREDGVPAVVVGGVALLDVEVAGEGRFVGTFAANAGGVHDVVVSTRRAAAVLRGGVRARAPRLERSGSGVRLVSRPGDRARVVASRGFAEGVRWEVQGAWEVDPERGLPFGVDVECGGEGWAEVALADVGEGVELVLQALVVPRGLEPGSPFARVTEAFVARW